MLYMIYIYTQYVGYNELHPGERKVCKSSTIVWRCRAFKCRETFTGYNIQRGICFNIHSTECKTLMMISDHRNIFP